MSSCPESDLLAKSQTGDRVALEELLALYFGSLTRHVGQRIPAGMRAVVDAEDIIQQAYVHVFRDIENCRATDEPSFFSWLRSIVDHRLHDAIRFYRAEKRGGKKNRASAVASPEQSSLMNLVELLSAGSHRPSRSAIRHEDIAAVHKAIESLPEKYRQAVQLRMLDGKSLAEAATAMECSPGTVQGLVDRAKRKLRVILGSWSYYE